MTIIKHLAFSIVLIFSSALLCITPAQTPRMTTVNISAQSDKVHITAEGDVAELRVDVADESGDVLFQSGTITSNTMDWNMRDGQGERIAPGTYLVTVTFRTAAGKLRKRVEQVTVAEEEKSGIPAPAIPAATSVTVMTSGTTTAGKIPKFATASTITNSIITESAAKVGVGITPGAASGKLVVAGQIQTTGVGAGIKFADNSIQTRAGLTRVAHDATLREEGTSAAPLGVAVPLMINQASPTFLISATVSNGGGGAISGSSLSNRGVSGSNSSGGTTFGGVYGISTGPNGAGVFGEANNGANARGLYGKSTSGFAGYFEGKVNIVGTLNVSGGCTNCGPPSDRNLKANFSTVNPRFILDRLASIPIQTWNYKSEPTGVRHIGAMAQDFRAAFGYGESDKTLNTVDANGVTMAAIQGLYRQNQKLIRKVEQQSRQITGLQARLNQVERTVRKRPTARRR